MSEVARDIGQPRGEEPEPTRYDLIRQASEALIALEDNPSNERARRQRREALEKLGMLSVQARWRDE